MLARLLNEIFCLIRVGLDLRNILNITRRGRRRIVLTNVSEATGIFQHLVVLTKGDAMQLYLDGA